MKTRSLFVSALLFAQLPLCVKALEGAVTSRSNEWKGVAPTKTVPDAQRAGELQARQKVMASHKKHLERRLSTVPSDAALAEMHAEMKKIKANFGWAEEQKMVWGVRDIDGILQDQGEVPKDLLAAIVQLKEDLAARDIDFIFIPYPPTPHYQGHLLSNKVNADQDYTPGWTRMLIQLLEHDIEVIDPLELYRKQAENPYLINWVNDFHTASHGREITAKLLAERLQRYDFVRELQGNRDNWSETMKESKKSSFPQRNFVVNKGLRSMKTEDIPPNQKKWHAKHPRKSMVLAPGAPNIEGELANRPYRYKYLKRNKVPESLRRNDLVLIGDSQLHSAVHGAGLPEFYMREIGGLFRWGSKSWSGFDPPNIYREVVPDDAEQPRVVVLSCLVKYFWDTSGKYKPRKLPPLAGVSARNLNGVTPAAAPVAGPSSSAKPMARIDRATIRITGISQPKDPDSVDYDEALLHASAQIVDGPMKGQEIGVRYWAMKDGALVKHIDKLKVGHSFPVALNIWEDTVQQDPSLARHMVYDDVEQDLTVPVYWVTKGPLSPEFLLR